LDKLIKYMAVTTMRLIYIIYTLVAFCYFGIISQAVALDVNFIEFGKPKELTRDAVSLFRQILPEADVLDLHIVMTGKKKTAVLTILINEKTADGFSIVREIPRINIDTYMVAWLLQGHFYFLKKEVTTYRQKRHMQLLGRYFDGKLIKGSDIFYLGEPIELYYEAPTPEVRGISLASAKIDAVLYSGYPKAQGFGKIILPGFRLKYIAVFPTYLKAYTRGTN
jgi:hypothetical protein